MPSRVSSGGAKPWSTWPNPPDGLDLGVGVVRYKDGYGEKRSVPVPAADATFVLVSPLEPVTPWYLKNAAGRDVRCYVTQIYRTERGVEFVPALAKGRSAADLRA